MKIVDGADVWMVELRAELGFAFKPPEVSGLLGQLGRQDLDDDGPLKLSVKRFINCSLAAGSYLLDDLVMINLGTDHIERGNGKVSANSLKMNAYPKMVADRCKADEKGR